MSGGDTCTIKLGNREMEANEVGEFCKAILDMKDSNGKRRSDGMRSYIRMAKKIEQKIKEGLTDSDAAAAAINELSTVIGPVEAKEAANMYMTRKNSGKNNYKPISDHALSDNYDFENNRSDSDMVDKYTMRYIQSVAKRKNFEVINIEMRVPKEIFTKDYLAGKRNVRGRDDMLILTVFRNNRDGSPQYVEEVDDAGNITRKRKTGIEAYSYDAHAGHGSDAHKLFTTQVMGGVQAEIVRKRQRRFVSGAPKVHQRTAKYYKEAAKKLGMRYVGDEIIQQETVQDIQEGVDENGNLTTVNPGIDLFSFKYNMQARKGEKKKMFD